MTETISSPGRTPTYVEVNFSWSPATSYTPPGITVPAAPGALIDTLITFTASITVHNQGNDHVGNLALLTIGWDFGDGTPVLFSGEIVTHTYTVPVLDTACVLIVGDILGRFWSARHTLYLT